MSTFFTQIIYFREDNIHKIKCINTYLINLFYYKINKNILKDANHSSKATNFQ